MSKYFIQANIFDVLNVLLYSSKEYILLAGSVGFFANLLTLPVLFTKKMQNTFNHLLIFLTIFDNIYVICSILECIRQNFISTPTQTVSLTL